MMKHVNNKHESVHSDVGEGITDKIWEGAVTDIKTFIKLKLMMVRHCLPATYAMNVLKMNTASNYTSMISMKILHLVFGIVMSILTLKRLNV